ncbi:MULTISPECIES: AbrB family transcriptional regulator [Gordonibacter]|uniref:AbrB family transcriptional regulator n=1 Tax=Gordonibacter faecis TaxID=3047475 RepID=A0ABT7DRQ1_9ACTN|nr:MULTISPECIES: AbrB family transcriptional regulator [unclassified Gordonibacter]MDJ1651211.1 AbrB family transcriptional regulator [Gordonibacter sp. KGMB12511]HIW77324.1 AbrB family transcriptional regulator [Candidatus Gordonibacter avicola]
MGDAVVGALVVTLVVGAAGGLLLKRLKVPAGLMIGAFVAVAVLNVSTGFAWLPSGTRTGVQIVAGAFVGCSLERSDVARLRSFVKPIVVMLVSFLILNLVLGFVLWATSPLDLVTSLMCAVPGGINDTPIVAADMGADAPAVTVMQLIRQVLGIGVFPVMIAAFDRLRTAHGHPDPGNRALASDAQRVKSKQKSIASTFAALVVATLAGLLGKATGVPGLTFTASILAVLVLKLGFDFAYIPKQVKKACQLVAGCYLGTLLTAEGLAGMVDLAVPALILVAGYTLNCFATGRLESRLFGYGRKEGMLIASPAGASDMALIMDDLGVQNTDVVIMQVVRAAFVMAFFPQIVNLICHFVGA